jgi:hypothetical protein
VGGEGGMQRDVRGGGEGGAEAEREGGGREGDAPSPFLTRARARARTHARTSLQVSYLEDGVEAYRTEDSQFVEPGEYDEVRDHQ